MRYVAVLGLACLAGSGTVLNARPGTSWGRTEPATPTILATPIAASAEAIRLNGELSDAVWKAVPAVTEFYQRDPDEGAPATHATEVRVAFDDRAIYVAVRAIEPDEGTLVGMLTRRDETSPSDWARVLIDSYRDGRTAYEFAVNAAGVKQDRYWYADTNQDANWDAVWDVAVHRGAGEWSAEFRIPFSQLRFDRATTGRFGFAVVREIAHLKETATWPLLRRSASGFVSSFGELTGLTFPATPRKLEVLPYAVGQTTTSAVAAGDPLASSPAATASAGLDFKYNLARGLTLTGTVNPDFGQVEADPAVVNLGGFETFFAERRPFFVEGSGNFSFDIDCNDGQCTGLFYSRRIGRAPQRVVNAPDGGFAAQPSSSTIAAAAKVTGRLGKYSIGVLHAVTTEEAARIADGPAAPISRTPVEPLTNYSVGRISREFADRSRLSFTVTNTARRLTDELQFLPRAATTGGVDADWRLGGDGYSLSGYWAGSSVRGSADAIDRVQRSTVHSFQRPDSEYLVYDPLRTSLQGHSGAVSFSKISGLRTRFNAYVGYKTPGFDINDLGYLQRADEIAQSNWLQVRSDRPTRWVRTRVLNLNQWTGWNFDGDLRFGGGNVNGTLVFTNNWRVQGGVNLQRRGFHDRLTRGGPGGYTNPSMNAWVTVSSDDRRLVAASLQAMGYRDRHATRILSVNPSVTWRPSRALSVGLGAGYEHRVNQSQWVTNLSDGPQTHYVFGRLDQTTLSLSARVNYTVTPTLSVQIYARPFVSAGAYSAFKELVDGRAERYEDRYGAFAYGRDPDFNVRSFRTTNVLRWEYRPGSALFIVWQQGREGVAGLGDFQFGRDFGGIFDAPATNVFLVKMSRWFSF